MKRTERLFAIAEILRGRRTGITAQALAERFGVSLRTMYRDLDSLRLANFPVEAEQGRGGGYALSQTYCLPPVNFTTHEALVLLTACDLMTKHRWMPFTKTMNSALEKVRAALPVTAQRSLARLRGSLMFTGVPVHSASTEVLQVVEQAWLEQRSLTILYDGTRGKTTRSVKLRSVVMERSQVLLNCTDLQKNQPRQFVLHKILSAAIDV